MKTLPNIILVSLALLLVALPVFAANTYVTNSPANWTNGLDWSNVPPGPPDNAYIGHGSYADPATVEFDEITTNTVSGVYLCAQNNSTGTLNVTSTDGNGTLTVAGTFYVGRYSASHASLHISNATVNASSGMRLGYHRSTNCILDLTLDPTAKLNVRGTVFYVNSAILSLPLADAPTPGKVFITNTVNVVVAGDYDALNSVGHLTINENSAPTATAGNLYVGGFGTGEHGGYNVTGTLVVAGVTLQASSLYMARTSWLGGNGDTTYGHIIVTNGAVVNLGGNCEVGTYYNNGGTFQLATNAQLNIFGSLFELTQGEYSLPLVNTPTDGAICLTNTIDLQIGSGYDANGSYASLTISSTNSATNLVIRNLYISNQDHYSQNNVGLLTLDGVSLTCSQMTLSNSDGTNTETVLTLTNGAALVSSSTLKFGDTGNQGVDLNIDESSQFTTSGDLWLDYGNYDFALSSTSAPGKFVLLGTPSIYIASGYDADKDVASLTLGTNCGSGSTFGNLYLAGSGGGQHAGINSRGSLFIDAVEMTFASLYMARGANWQNNGGSNNAEIILRNGAAFNLTGSVISRLGPTNSVAFVGDGTISIAGTFNANGRAVADSGTLAITNTGALTQNESHPVLMGDGNQAGWYAINGGEMHLGRLWVIGNMSWGEDTGDTTLDLVNSVRMQDWSGLTPGNLAISVLATNHASFTRMKLIPIGVWHLDDSVPGALSFATVDLVFRYDDMLATELGVDEDNLAVFRWSAGEWEELASAADDVNKTVVVSNVTAFGQFAIGPRIQIDNSGGATNVTESTAWVNGELFYVGSTNADVWVFYGTNDEEGVFPAWDSNVLVGIDLMPTSFTRQVAGLMPDTLYHYRGFATNDHGQWDWPDSAETWLTGSSGGKGNVWLEATDPLAYETGLDSGTIVVHRPNTPAATKGPLLVNYTLSGSAGNGVDYSWLSGTVTIPAGSDTAEIVVRPIYDDFYNEGVETATVTLAEGPYVISATNSAGVRIIDNGPGDFTYKMKITFRGYDKGDALTNFPALVVFHEGLHEFAYSMFASPVGSDLRFANSNESELLYYEPEQWDISSNSYVWVNVPLLENGTFIWAYFGNRFATNAPPYTTNGATWNQDFMGVWHMAETNTQDSTSRGHHGSAVNGPTNAIGIIGPSVNFVQAANQYINIPASTNFDLTASGWTLSAWVYQPSSSQGGIFGNHNVGFILAAGNGGNYLSLYNRAWWGTTDMSMGGWKYVTVSQGANTEYYVNGIRGQSQGGVYTVSSTRNLEIGSGGPDWTHFDGYIDEVRIERGGRSTNWIWATWMNAISNALFVDYGRPFGPTLIIVR